MKNEKGITWERYQQLHRDLRTAKRLSAESGEPYDTFLTAYIKRRWTRDEIRFFALDYLELTRRHEDVGMEELLRTYWYEWLDRLAVEEQESYRLAKKRQSSADRAACAAGNARFDRKGRKASAK